MLRKPRRKRTYEMPYSSPETKMAHEKGVDVAVIYRTDEKVFQRTISFMKIFYEKIYGREFDISAIGSPDPTLGYSTGILLDIKCPYAPIIYTKWGAIRFLSFGMSEIDFAVKTKSAVSNLGLYTTYRSSGFLVCKELPESRLVPSWERDRNHVARLTAWDMMLEEHMFSSERSYIEEPVFQYS